MTLWPAGAIASLDRWCLAGGGEGLLVLPGPLLAVTSFPRGPGLYLNLFIFALVLVGYLAWIYASAWVSADSHRLRLPRFHWNMAVFGGGVIGLVVFWLLPWFFLAFPLMLAAWMIPLAGYVRTRNRIVPEAERVWTSQHLREILDRLLFRKAAEVEPARPSVRFYQSGPSRSREPIRGASDRAGYRTAVELVRSVWSRRADMLLLLPDRGHERVRVRIDGVLHQLEELPRLRGEEVVQVFKYLGGLDLNEHRKPQDGAFTADVERHRVDVRVHSDGSLAGERLVLRFDRPERSHRRLDQLNLQADAVETVRRWVRQKKGMIVISGPPASGRTTLARACLLEVDRLNRSVVCIARSFPGLLPQVEQIPWPHASGETQAQILARTVQQQSPDVIGVDDLSDATALEMLYANVKDGRLVLGVVDASDAMATLGWLTDHGLSAQRIARSLLGIVSIRLLRVLCGDCKIRYRPDPEVLQKANLAGDRVSAFFRPPEPGERPTDSSGNEIVCSTCGGTGYFGQQPICEVMPIAGPLRDLIRREAPAASILQAAIRNGLVPFQDAAMRLVINGTTSVQELLRVFRSVSHEPAQVT